MSEFIKDFVTNLVAGCAGGTACVYAGQPLDTVKVKLQTFPSLYSGTIDCFRTTLKAEGIGGLYKGSMPALLCNVSENAVLFVALGCMKDAIASFTNKQKANLSNVENACAGSLASIFSSLVVCPTELIKCRMQAQTELHASGNLTSKLMTPLGIVKQMIRTEGVRSLFNGLTSTWMREMPGYFVFFYSYEFTRNMLTPNGKTKDDIGILRTAFAGGTAGLGLWVAIFPIDVIKSRIQVLSAAGKQEGFSKTFLWVVRHEGFRALYSGLLPTVIRTYPANGALFVAFEYSSKWFRKQMRFDE